MYAFKVLKAYYKDTARRIATWQSSFVIYSKERIIIKTLSPHFLDRHVVLRTPGKLLLACLL